MVFCNLVLTIVNNIQLIHFIGRDLYNIYYCYPISTKVKTNIHMVTSINSTKSSEVENWADTYTHWILPSDNGGSCEKENIESSDIDPAYK